METKLLLTLLSAASAANPCAFSALTAHFGYSGCGYQAENYHEDGESVELAIHLMQRLFNVSHSNLTTYNKLNLRRTSIRAMSEFKTISKQEGFDRVFYQFY